MLCRDWCLIKRHEGGVSCITLFCNSWQCEVCRERRAKRLVMDAKGGKPNTFITLTVNPAIGSSPEDRAQKLAHAWRLVRQRAMRRYGYRRLPFLCVFERTKRGEPHLHILARVKWIDQKWLSAQMDELMGAPIVDIRRVSGARKIAAYIAKYVGKDPTHFGNCKRYWKTQDWNQWRQDKDKDPVEYGFDWVVVKQSVKSWVAMMEGMGWTASLTRGGYDLARTREP